MAPMYGALRGALGCGSDGVPLFFPPRMITLFNIYVSITLKAKIRASQHHSVSPTMQGVDETTGTREEAKTCR